MGGFGSSPRVRGKRGQFRGTGLDGRIIPARAGQTAPYWPPWPWRPDHPRACGANYDALIGERTECGSSPRVRGKRCRLRWSFCFVRIIPARAGQTAGRCQLPLSAADHPRACGANDLSFTDLRGADGSSPRVRGKLLHGRLLRRQRRIIPARAGQTSACVRTSPTRSDHPRACGANNGTYLSFEPSTGSSPRVRGKLHCCSVVCVFGSSPRVRGKRKPFFTRRAHRRIIPARAGQTANLWAMLESNADHPRACGANCPLVGDRVQVVGSSPRVRGKQIRAAGHETGRRIIPARAGQTVWRSTRSRRPADHPRACGANLCWRAPMSAVRGSSPRVRGKRTTQVPHMQAARIIPARAGQTQYSRLFRRARPDHPRACGANSAMAASIIWVSGSSPRVRGKRRQGREARRQRRIIPARAGQTLVRVVHAFLSRIIPARAGQTP